MQDFIFIFQWYSVFLLIGLIFLPLTFFILSEFIDRGYIFSKILGIILISYLVFFFSSLKIFTFNISIVFALFISLVSNYFIARKAGIKRIFQGKIRFFVIEEILFAVCLAFWSFVKGNQPDIHGLEKYMDFGFVNSILRSTYLPPKDIWFTPFSINYYYFGHLMTAVLTRISGIPSNITFNLMIAVLFALTFVSAFSIAINLLKSTNMKKGLKFFIPTGILTAFIVTLGGNLQTIYTFFKAYPNDSPVPFWQLPFQPLNFPNSYWYPNATRFIYHTIHEFPSYSWVVSDLHGHVLDIPVVLLTIALLLTIFLKKQVKLLYFPLIGFLLSVMYMTNAWDGVIYLLLSAAIFLALSIKYKTKKLFFSLRKFATYLLLVLISYFIFSLPFNLSFKPFVSGIGVLCAPQFLVSIGKFGPFLFEADHCQLSPPWQLGILYGFFYFMVISYALFLKKIKEVKKEDIFIIILIVVSSILILLPEFVYVKDIYPTYYRANTMFKLVYQAFIMLSLSSGYIIIKIFSQIKKVKINKSIFIAWTVVLFFLLFLACSYPFFSIQSYYNNLQNYVGLDGTKYLKTLYPSDYKAIIWLNKNIKEQPVILEAQGDSYTDYARISSNTGLPTVLGWTVHEWLWRGTYDIPAPRIADVTTLYETPSIEKARSLIKKYNVSLVFVGTLERQKYPNFNEEKFKKLGKLIYQNGDTRIYKINPLSI